MRRSTHVAVLVCLVALAGCASFPGGSQTAAGGETGETVTTAGSTAGGATGTATESRPTVTLRDANGTRLGTVRVWVSDTRAERYTGLSDTESMAADEGMLFVHDEAGEYAYVMRRMAFPLDIIFVAENGTVTTVHHAPLEPDASEGELTRYPGRGKYVLEVNRGYANRTGVEVGDTLELPANVD